MTEHIIMDAKGIQRTLVRLSHEIIEQDCNLDQLVLIGIRRGGEIVAARIAECLFRMEGIKIPSSGIDITMRRDDLVSAFFVPEFSGQELTLSVENKIVVLCDDVLNSGRTVRAAIEEIFCKGRPKAIRLLELIDRGGRELPVRADFVGKNVPTSHSEYIDVQFTEIGAKEDKIVIKKENTDA